MTMPYTYHSGIREDKDTTKVKVVFDASFKGTGGLLLNDALLIGPKLQSDLRVLLMKWRKFNQSQLDVMLLSFDKVFYNLLFLILKL